MRTSGFYRLCLYSFLTIVWPCLSSAAVTSYFDSDANSFLLNADTGKAAMARISTLSQQKPHVKDVKRLVDFLVDQMDAVRQDAQWYRGRTDAFVTEQKKRNSKLNGRALILYTSEKINTDFKERLQLEVKNKFGSFKKTEDTWTMSHFISDNFTKRTSNYTESEYLKKNASGDTRRLTIYARKIAQKIAAYEDQRTSWLLGQQLYTTKTTQVEPQLEDLQRSIDIFWEEVIALTDWVAQDD